MKRPSGSRRVRKSCPLTAPKSSAKNAVDSRVAKVGLPSSRTCVGINVRGRGEQLLAALQNHGNPVAQRRAKLLSRTCGNNRNLHYFSPGGKKIADKRPPFWGPETKTGTKSSGHKQIKLRLNEWPPFWGLFLDTKTGAVLPVKFLVTGRKIARVSIVSARARQKFSMPLLFHGFAAPQALVLHTLRTFMATHVLELGRPSVAGPVFAGVFGPQNWCPEKSLFSIP